MGNNGTDVTKYYAETGNIPHFKLYRTQDDKLINLEVQNTPSWEDLGLFVISLSELVELPKSFNLEAAYPNPFNPTTTIHFSLPIETEISMSIHDLQGRQIMALLNDKMKAGYHSVIWNANQHSSGIYFIKMVTNEYVSTQKLMLIK